MDVPNGSVSAYLKRVLTSELTPGQTYTVTYTLDKGTVANDIITRLSVDGTPMAAQTETSTGQVTHTFTLPSSFSSVVYLVIAQGTAASDQWFTVDNFKITDGTTVEVPAR